MDERLRGTYAVPDTAHVEIRLEGPTRHIGEELTLALVDRGADWVTMEGSDGETWLFVRYDQLADELLGRWLTLPRNDPRFFVEFKAPDDIVWRRRHGMRRAEDRFGGGWMRGDTLFVHRRGFPPIVYSYRIAGDSLIMHHSRDDVTEEYLRAR